MSSAFYSILLSKKMPACRKAAWYLKWYWMPCSSCKETWLVTVIVTTVVIFQGLCTFSTVMRSSVQCYQLGWQALNKYRRCLIKHSLRRPRTMTTERRFTSKTTLVEFSTSLTMSGNGQSSCLSKLPKWLFC